MTESEGGTESEAFLKKKPGEVRRRLLWFVALWLGGVLTLAAFSFAVHAVFPSP